jgi:hypothetical protein
MDSTTYQGVCGSALLKGKERNGDNQRAAVPGQRGRHGVNPVTSVLSTFRSQAGRTSPALRR